MNRQVPGAPQARPSNPDRPKPTDELAVRLIRQAARRSPAALSERLEEEWLADLAVRHSRLSRLGLALGCWWATRVIAHEHGIARVPAPAGGSRALALYVQRDAAFVSRRTPAILAIVIVHAVLVYLFVGGLAPTLVKPASGPAKVSFPEDPHPPQQTPPQIGGPHLTQPIIVPPEVPPLPQDPDQNPIVAKPDPQPATQGITQVAVKRVWGGPGKGFPATQDYYPAQLIRAGVGGITIMHVCVGPNGRLNAEPAVAVSSGNVLLDRSATRLATAGSGYYRPTTDDGRPVDACYNFGVRFNLR